MRSEPGEVLALLDRVPAAVIACDLDGVITMWNAGATALYGWAREEVLGRRMRELVLRGQPLADEVSQAARRGETWSGEMQVAHRDGSSLLVFVRNGPLVENGEVVGIIGASTELSAPRRLEAERAEALEAASGRLAQTVHRLQRLQSLTVALVGAGSRAEVHQAVLTAGKDALGAAAIALAEVDPVTGDLRVVDLAGFSAAFVRDYERIPLTVDTPLTRAYLLEQPQLYPDAVAMRDAFPDVTVDDAFEARGAVPLLAPSGCVGGLTLSFAEPRLFDTDEVELLLSVSRLAGQALERVALAEAHRDRQQRDAFLARVGRALNQTLDTGRVADSLVAAVVPELGDWAVLHLRDDTDREHYRVAAVAHTDPLAQERMQAALLGLALDVDNPGGAGPAIRNRETQLHLQVPPAVAKRLGEAPADTALLPVDSGLVVPLLSGDRCWGSLALAREGAAYSPEEVALLEELGVRAATALSHAHAFVVARRAALELQLALLPPSRPDIPGLDIGWQYLPGTAGSLIGGDWYDVVPLPADRVLLVVGDVMGRGPAAAAVMGQLRTMTRALTRVGMPPGQVVRELHDELLRTSPDRITTMVLVELDLRARTATITNAGHLPPVLLGPDGARLLDVPPGAPLGVDVFDATLEVTLPPGAGLVLYTDGLVEDRTRSLDDGLAMLTTACAALPLDAAEASQRLLLEMGRADAHDDDVAVLVVRLA